MAEKSFLLSKEILGEHITLGLRLQDVILGVEEAGGEKIRNLREAVTNSIDENEGVINKRLLVLDVVSRELFNENLTDVLGKARQTLSPYRDEGKEINSLIISSATTSSGSWEVEQNILKERGMIVDMPGAIEGRDVRSAKEGDVAVVATSAGLEMAEESKGVEIINLADELILRLSSGNYLRGKDLYYKSDALLLLILTNPNSDIINQALDLISENILIYPYNLDEETQLVLYWLARKAGLDKLNVNANSPEVAMELTRKGFRYPDISGAIQLSWESDVYKAQFEEWRSSLMAREIGYYPDSMPGYYVPSADNFNVFKRNVLSAFMLLAVKYGLNEAWYKPDRGTDGGGQGKIFIGVGNNEKRERLKNMLRGDRLEESLSLYSQYIGDIKDDMEAVIKNIWDQGQHGEIVVEAKANYFKLDLDLTANEKREVVIMPSVHIIRGRVRDTISLQIMDGKAWGGNIICSYSDWVDLIDRVEDERLRKDACLVEKLKESYWIMIEKMQNYTDAINSSEKYQGGQVRGGADLALATIGGDFGDNLIIGVQDYNARANGCETAYFLFDKAQKNYGEVGTAVTRNIIPQGNFREINEALNQIAINLGLDQDQVKLIAVSAGWGQIGIVGKEIQALLKKVFLIEERLRAGKLIK